MTPNTKILIRDFNYKQAYKDWVVGAKHQELAFLRESYEDYLINGNSPKIVLEKGKGFEAVLWKNLKGLNVPCLLDYLRAKIIALGYYNYLSDVRHEYFDGGIKLEYERHLLKPISAIKPKQTLQPHFGSIHLENCKQSNSALNMIKVMVANQKEVLPFHHLMRELMKEAES